jgi:S1-C subfamily serine protease
VRSIARLRAAQGAFVLEYDKRSREAARGEDPMQVEKPVTLNGVEFKTLQAAHSYLSTLREQLLATETARFAGTVSAIFAESLRPVVSPRKVILDAGFTEASDVALLEGDLATGGLVRSLKSRQSLQSKGVAIVVAPRVERVGSNYAVRAEVYDLGKPNLVASSSVRVDQRYAKDLARMLEVDDLSPVDDLPAVERASWEKVYKEVASGAVVLTGKHGEGGVQGSGFVVSPDGLVMTNSHVVSGIEPGSGTAHFPGGTQAAFRIVKDDPFWDVAVVKVDALPEGTHVFRFADGERVKVGVEVAVLGAPKGTSGWVFTPGHVSSVRELVQTSGNRPSLMYTCATRAGSSGSPVLLQDGTVAAVHSAGTMGDVKDTNGYQVVSGNATVFSELPGFALGAPGPEARKVLEGAGGTR